MKVRYDPYPTRDKVIPIRAGLQRYNVAKVPQLSRLPGDEFAVVLRQGDAIIGGAICEFDWGWLYTDTVWVSDDVRGKGYGKHIMEAAHHYAASKGITSAYLLTSSFQARPFYEKLGYEVFGQTDDRPIGHTTYYLRHTNLQAGTIPPRIEIQNPPQKAVLDFLNHHLIEHSKAFRAIEFDYLTVFLEDASGKVRGGIYGSTFWDWYDIRYLWVDEALRGQGYGKQIVHIAEQEARARGARGMVADTASFQALPFYQQQGFEVFGTLVGRPPQHESYFILKPLNR